MSSPIYTPGNEPDELYEKICVFLDDIDKVFPENRVYLDKWNHERWDRPIEYLCRSLGYEKGRDFLYAYGYGVFEKTPSPQKSNLILDAAEKLSDEYLGKDTTAAIKKAGAGIAAKSSDVLKSAADAIGEIQADMGNGRRKGAVEATLDYVDKRRNEKKAAERLAREKAEREAREAKEHRRAFFRQFKLVFIILALLIAACAAFFAIRLAKANEGKISPGKSSYDLRSMHYESAVAQLEQAGFKDIQVIPDYDMVFGIFNDDGDVESVEIDGESTFSATTKFNPDAFVIVTYHTYPPSSSSDSVNTEEDSTEVITQMPLPEHNTPAPQNEPATPTPEGITYHSSGDRYVAQNGNSGVYAYKSRGGQYTIYYVIDFDSGYVYCFRNDESVCERLKIDSGDLKTFIVFTYHDGGDTWQNAFSFKYATNPEHALLQDGTGYDTDFYSTDLDEAVKIRDSKTMRDY